MSDRKDSFWNNPTAAEREVIKQSQKAAEASKRAEEAQRATAQAASIAAGVAAVAVVNQSRHNAKQNQMALEAQQSADRRAAAAAAAAAAQLEEQRRHNFAMWLQSPNGQQYSEWKSEAEQIRAVEDARFDLWNETYAEWVRQGLPTGVELEEFKKIARMEMAPDFRMKVRRKGKLLGWILILLCFPVPILPTIFSFLFYAIAGQSVGFIVQSAFVIAGVTCGVLLIRGRNKPDPRLKEAYATFEADCISKWGQVPIDPDQAGIVVKRSPWVWSESGRDRLVRNHLASFDRHAQTNFPEPNSFPDLRLEPVRTTPVPCPPLETLRIHFLGETRGIDA